MFQLREKLNESLSAVIPITAIVLILSISVAPVESGVMMLFIFGALMLIFGMSLFTLGAGMSMQPMGEGIGVEVSKSRKIALSLLVCLVLGILITVAEPDLQVLAEQIPSIPNMVLILTVAVGVGLFLTISLLRIVFGIPLARLLLIAYVIVFVLAFFVPVNFIPAAFDSGGVTTGPITVPFIMALGVGLAAIRSDRRSAEDSFGLVALCSIGPILAVLILSLFFEPNATAEEHLIPAVHTTQDAIRAFVHTLPEYAKEVMVAFAPIVCVFVLFQLISRRFRARQLLRVGLGFLYTYLGLVLFLCGANVGFMPAGQLIGGAIAGGAFRYLLVPIGMVVGYFIVAAEPAVHVLKKQVEEISNGQISQKSIGMGLSVGVSVSVAHGLGGQQKQEVHRAVHTAIPTALFAGIILTGIGLFFSETFLVLMDTPVNVLPHSAKYMRITFCGMTFTMLYNFAASILNAAGDTKSPFVFLTISGVINVILNIILVTVFHMDVDGVAIATVVAQALSAVLILICLMRRNDACRFTFSKMRFYKAPFMKIIRFGLPAGFQSCLFSICNVLIQSSINSFHSDAIMSGNGASANIEGFVYALMNSIHLAAVNFTGQNAGAKEFGRVKKTFFICLGLVVAFGFGAGASAWVMREPLLRIYIKDSPEAIKWGMVRMTYICLPYFLNGLQDVTIGAVHGLGISVIPTLISILSICGVRILWIYSIFQIPQYHTMQCLYLSYTISWSATILSQSAIFAYACKRKSRAKPLRIF